MKRLRLAFRYARSSRIPDYSRVLKIALQAGYHICSVYDSVKALASNIEPLLVLRHDVDQPSPGVIAMAELEAEFGISSTYYFRWSTFDLKEIERVAGLGHEVSFHYETISDYALENEIFDRQVFECGDHINRCVDRLKYDVQIFRELSGAKAQTLASHGAPLNRQLGLSNRILFDLFPELRKQIGIKLETYDSWYLGELDAYISDTLWEINDGFRYGLNPEAAISRKTPRFILLTHPNHWAFDRRTRIRRIFKILLLGMGQDNCAFRYRSHLRRASQLR